MHNIQDIYSFLHVNMAYELNSLAKREVNQYVVWADFYLAFIWLNGYQNSRIALYNLNNPYIPIPLIDNRAYTLTYNDIVFLRYQYDYDTFPRIQDI